MIKKRPEQAVEIREAMRGGAGKVSIRHYFRSEEITAPCRLCSELILPPGASIGMHEHIGEDEVYIIQQGTGIVNVDGNESEIVAGDAILTGKGASHSIRNTGNKDLVVTAVIMLYHKD